MPTVRPIGSSPGKYFLAADSLMIDDGRRARAIGGVEQAAAPERNLERAGG